MNDKRVLCLRIIIPSVMYGTKIWGPNWTELKANVFEMKYLKNKV